MVKQIRRAAAASGLVAAGLLLASAPAFAADSTTPDQPAVATPTPPTPPPSEQSIYDKIWSYATLYNNKENPWIENFKIVGREQLDVYYFRADQTFDQSQKDSEEDFVDRRTRIGFQSLLFGNQIEVHTEVDLNLEPHGQTYNKFTDAYVKYMPYKWLNITVGKQSAKFTLDGSISSTQLVTIDRSNLANNFWFTEEYIPGVTASGDYQNWQYYAGWFSAGVTTREFGKFNAGSFGILSGGYNFASLVGVDKALLRLDYMHQDNDVDFAYKNSNLNNFTNKNRDVGSLNFQGEMGRWGFMEDVSFSRGAAGQSNMEGLQLQPSVKFCDTWQGVLRYTFIHSDDPNGIKFARYENVIINQEAAARTIGKTGNEYNEIYAGINKYFYGHKLKWQNGIQYTAMDDKAHDGGKYGGWGVTSGLRVSW
ncbi:MAG TPA: porin [Candidatus Binatia bacterium]|jgi:phosphate-selective porin OprO/OprP